VVCKHNHKHPKETRNICLGCRIAHGALLKVVATLQEEWNKQSRAQRGTTPEPSRAGALQITQERFSELTEPDGLLSFLFADPTSARLNVRHVDEGRSKLKAALADAWKKGSYT
jgi:hypothetical protein